MALSKWHEQMMENVLPLSSHDSVNNTRKTITTTGKIRSSLDASSVYRVSRKLHSFYQKQLLSALDRCSTT